MSTMSETDINNYITSKLNNETFVKCIVYNDFIVKE